MNRLLFLCIDMQPAFLNAIDGGPEVLRRCVFATEVAAGLGIPVVFTEQVSAKLGATDSSLLQKAPVAPRFDKCTFSAHADDTIRAMIEGGGVEHVLICGIETPVCIYQTALDLLRGGLQVTLLSDCLGGRRRDDARVCLEALAQAGAHVLPSETVYYALLKSAKHPYFKTYTQIVKNHG